MKSVIAIITVLFSLSSALSQEMTTTISNTTPNCRDGNRAVQQVCLPEGQELGNWSYNVTRG